MSTTRDICDALIRAAGPVNCAELAEASGRAEKQISSSLIPLVNCGAVERIIAKDGGRHTYQVKDQEKVAKRAGREERAQPPQKSSGPKRVQRKAGKPKKSKQRQATKTKRAKKAATAATTTARNSAAAPGPVLTYFIDEAGDVQIMRIDGKGEAAIIPRADAVRLSAFLARVASMLEPA